MESEGRLPRNDKEEQQRRADALENWEQDPNSSVLLDPAAERGWLCWSWHVEGVTTAAEVSHSWMPSHES